MGPGSEKGSVSLETLQEWQDACDAIFDFGAGRREMAVLDEIDPNYSDGPELPAYHISRI